MIESKEVMFQSNDTLFSTTSTTPVLAKTFRFTHLNGVINDVMAMVSAWNESPDEITTITIEINGKSVGSTVMGNQEHVKRLVITIPLGYEINTLNLYIQTSNASYKAYTQLLEVVGR